MIPFHSISKPHATTAQTPEVKPVATVVTVSIKSDSTKTNETQKATK